MKTLLAAALIALLSFANEAYAQCPMVALLSSVTTGTLSASVDVSKWRHLAVQVTTDSTCSTLDLAIEGLLGGAVYAPLPISGGASSIAQTDLPGSNTSRIWTLPQGLRRVRAHANTVTSCPVSVYLAECP